MILLLLLLFALPAAPQSSALLSRVDSVKICQQIASLLVLPMVGVMIAQSIGVFVLDPLLVLAACGVMVALDGGVLWIAVQLFERENILTRWK